MRSIGMKISFAITVCSLSFCGCKPNPNQGFYVGTFEKLQNPNNPSDIGPSLPLVGTDVTGQCEPGSFRGCDTGGLSAGGSNTSYSGSTSHAVNNPSLLGYYYASNAVAPAYWDHEVWLPSVCNYPLPPAYYIGSRVFPQAQNGFEVDHLWTPNTGIEYQQDTIEAVEWDCLIAPGVIPPASPDFAFAGNIPATVTLPTTDSFATQSGMPQMYVFAGENGSSALYTLTTATSVSSDGSSATFPLPGSLPQGAYGFETVNQNPDGSVSPNSFNYFAAAGSQTVSGNPFGVAAGGIYTGSAYRPIPIVSLYSQGQVLIGNTTVTVGSNPTAVAVYPAPPEGTYSSSTSQRAVVANSGDNTISILDILNDYVLSTITVGNHPVALAVSSDGSAVYVANYADGTVSRVNLTTYTHGIVAVGGHPTSVALTAAGTLWVGGAGFLTEVNAQTMTVTATQTTNKTIVALGYSDAENELIATSADTYGNVFIDEVAPATVQTGTQFTPMASHTVSTLGSYQDPSTGATVQGYTATLATQPIRFPRGPMHISPLQPGAPPLVVQDGWAVVSATPTGFTITDASGHQVLVSETTPSPVTGIAVDTNLNAAYLVMPDSNTLLTVPLPGVSGSSAPASPPATTETPYNNGNYTVDGSQEIDFTLTLYDNTPGATIYYQTSCPGDAGEESSGGSFDLIFQIYSGCNPSGTMYAQAPGSQPSATVPIDFP